MDGQLLCLGKNNNVVVQGQLCVVCFQAAGDLVHSKILVLLCFAFMTQRTFGNDC